jgi:hypothetical protein
VTVDELFRRRGLGGHSHARKLPVNWTEIWTPNLEKEN